LIPGNSDPVAAFLPQQKLEGPLHVATIQSNAIAYMRQNFRPEYGSATPALESDGQGMATALTHAPPVSAVPHRGGKEIRIENGLQARHGVIRQGCSIRAATNR